MENYSWMSTNFCAKLNKWMSDSMDQDYDVDDEILDNWYIVMARAEKFDEIKDKYKTHDKDWFTSNEGCIFMTELAMEAARVSNTLSSLISLIVLKVIDKEKESEKALKADGDAPVQADQDVMRAYQGQNMDVEFSIGKEQIHFLVLQDLDSWGQHDWIHTVYSNMISARSLSYGYCNVLGQEDTAAEKFTISVDCYMKNLKPNQEPLYYRDFVKGNGSTRIIATAEAVMKAHWKIAHWKLEMVLETKLESWDLQFFPDKEDEGSDAE